MAVEIKLLQLLLANQGYNVTIKEGQQPGQVNVVEGGISGCGDGRPDLDPDAALRPGPKLFGGLFGPAAQIAKLSRSEVIAPQHLMDAGRRIANLGFQPTIHTDEADHPCGFEGLMMRGAMRQLPRLELPQATIQDVLAQIGGVRTVLEGEHRENRLVINTVPMTTRTPDNQAFDVDIWAAQLIGLPTGEVIATSGQVVTTLTKGGVRDVEIWK